MAVTRAPDGVVYTPRAVCEPMVRRALEPLVAGRTAEQILALRVCDPAIGEGAFLVEIVRVLAEAIDRPDARRLVAERCVHGVDIDARAVALARAAVERFAGAPVPALRDHLRVGDALAIEWRGDFDAVVGNPPYIRQERLGSKKQALRGFASYDGAADLYVYFVELAHRIARRGGRYCLVVPSKWMTAAYGRRLRELLAAAGSVEGIVELARPLFDGVDAFPCIVWGTVGGARSLVAAKLDLPVADALREVGTVQVRDRWQGGPWHIDEPGDAALIDRLARSWPALGDIVGPPSRGVVTGCNRAFVIDAATRDRLVAAEPESAALIRPFVKGRDVRRWRPAPIDRRVLLIDRGTSPGPQVLEYLAQFRDDLEPGRGRKPGTYRWFELQDPVVPLAKSGAPRLLYQDIQTGPACCLDDTGELVPDTTVWILPSADRFLLAVLNSSLYAWYARRRFPPALNGAVRPKLEYMRGLPIATPGPALRRQIEELVALQLAGPTAARDAELDRAVLEAYEITELSGAVASAARSEARP